MLVSHAVPIWGAIAAIVICVLSPVNEPSIVVTMTDSAAADVDISVAALTEYGVVDFDGRVRFERLTAFRR